MKYGVEVYTPEKKRNLLSNLFEEESLEIKTAEDHICNFREQYQTFS